MRISRLMSCLPSIFFPS
ncbi:putative peroxidase 18 [Iris pallida]|uniref:Peroxidase 18 n=1 Tax=Iris pallida TaxID=29817 RepID=A0AAX6HSS3_IRIPA|nr:putative peroxidase 18 [Iris pallida]